MKKTRNILILYFVIAIMAMMFAASCQRGLKTGAPMPDMESSAQSTRMEQEEPGGSTYRPSKTSNFSKSGFNNQSLKPIARFQVKFGDGESSNTSTDSDSYPQYETAQGLTAKDEQETDKKTSSQQPNILQDRKIIRTAQMTIYVEDFEKGAEKITAIAHQYNGVVANTQVSRYASSVNGTITLWVPAEKLVPAVDDLKKVGKVTSASVTADDISAEYFDLEARLNNAKKKEERLQQFYAKAKNINDLISVENELSSTREQIEGMEGQKRMWDKQVAYTTVTITLNQDIEVVKEPDDVWKPLRQAIREIKPTFIGSVQSFGGCIGGLILLVIALIPWLIVIIPAVFIWKKYFRPKWQAFWTRRREEWQRRSYRKQAKDIPASPAEAEATPPPADTK